MDEGTIPLVDVASLPGPAQRILDPSTPAPLRQMAAKGIAPGLKPGDAITLVALLAEGADSALAAVARATLANLPAPVLNGALSGDMHPAVIHVIAPYYAKDVAVMERLLALPSILPITVARAATVSSEQVSELIATNESRLLACPEIIERLYMNKATRMSTADRILELAVRNKIELPGIPAYKEAALAITNELIPEASAEPTPDDILFNETVALGEELEIADGEDTHIIDPETGEERVKDELKPLEDKVSKLTISQKIRMAMLGNASQRRMLVRDSNKLVAAAVARSPAMQENEVLLLSAAPYANSEALRIISTNGTWTRVHQIKYNLVANPRTPFSSASKLMVHLREDELKKLSKSRSVTGEVQSCAKQQLQRKGK